MKSCCGWTQLMTNVFQRRHTNLNTLTLSPSRRKLYKTFTTRFTMVLINLQFTTTPAYALPSHNLGLECFNLSNVGCLRNWCKHTNTQRLSLSTTRLLKSKSFIPKSFCEILMVI